MVENRCGTECKAAGPVYFDQERKKSQNSPVWRSWKLHGDIVKIRVKESWRRLST